MLLQAAKILKDIVVQQLSFYWKASNKDESPSKTSSMGSDAWQHVEHPASTAAPSRAVSPATQPLACTQQSDDSVSADDDRADVLLPTKCELTISISTDKQTGVTHIGANAKVDRLEVQVHKEQISDMVFMQDQYAIWLLRNHYAALRPTGWRSPADKAVPPRQVTLAMFACETLCLVAICCHLCTMMHRQERVLASNYHKLWQNSKACRSVVVTQHCSVELWLCGPH